MSVQFEKKKQILCPACKVGLEVKNSKNEPEKAIDCPNCHTHLKIIFKPLSQTASGDPNATRLGLIGLAVKDATQYGQSEDCAATQIGGGSTAPASPGYLMCNGRQYPLRMGLQTIGRISRQRPADVMLDVNDQYMSRQHIAITVNKCPNGKVQVSVRNFKNTNVTFIAGQQLQQGDEVFLTSGMTIKMGDTTITYYQ